MLLGTHGRVLRRTDCRGLFTAAAGSVRAAQSRRCASWRTTRACMTRRCVCSCSLSLHRRSLLGVLWHVSTWRCAPTLHGMPSAVGGVTLRGSDRVCPHVFSRRCTRARARAEERAHAQTLAQKRPGAPWRAQVCKPSHRWAARGDGRRDVYGGIYLVHATGSTPGLGVLRGGWQEWAMANYAAELHAVYDAFNASVPPTHWHSHDGSVPPCSAPAVPRPLYSAAQPSTQNELRRARRPRPRPHAHAHWRNNAADTPPTHARAYLDKRGWAQRCHDRSVGSQCRNMRPIRSQYTTYTRPMRGQYMRSAGSYPRDPSATYRPIRCCRRPTDQSLPRSGATTRSRAA